MEKWSFEDQYEILPLYSIYLISLVTFTCFISFVFLISFIISFSRSKFHHTFCLAFTSICVNFLVRIMSLLIFDTFCFTFWNLTLGCLHFLTIFVAHTFLTLFHNPFNDTFNHCLYLFLDFFPILLSLFLRLLRRHLSYLILRTLFPFLALHLFLLVIRCAMVFQT